MIIKKERSRAKLEHRDARHTKTKLIDDDYDFMIARHLGWRGECTRTRKH